MTAMKTFFANSSLSVAELKNLLGEFLDFYCTPGFGSASKKEIDLFVFYLLIKCGYISIKGKAHSDESLYSIARKLRITKTKARNLIYEYSLRSYENDDMKEELKKALINTGVQKDGTLFVIEIENPCLIDFLKDELKKEGHIADGSFAPGVVKLNLDAMTALIKRFLPEDAKNELNKRLKKAGAPDTSVSGLIKSALSNVAKKYFDEAGSALINKHMDTLLNKQNIDTLWNTLIKKEQK